jgi:hypothetical protein
LRAEWIVYSPTDSAEDPNFKDMRAFDPLILGTWEFPVGHWTFRCHSCAHQCFPGTGQKKVGIVLGA